MSALVIPLFASVKVASKSKRPRRAKEQEAQTSLIKLPSLAAEAQELEIIAIYLRSMANQFDRLSAMRQQQ